MTFPKIYLAKIWWKNFSENFVLWRHIRALKFDSKIFEILHWCYFKIYRTYLALYVFYNDLAI